MWHLKQALPFQCIYFIFKELTLNLNTEGSYLVNMWINDNMLCSTSMNHAGSVVSYHCRKVKLIQRPGQSQGSWKRKLSWKTFWLIWQTWIINSTRTSSCISPWEDAYWGNVCVHVCNIVTVSLHLHTHTHTHMHTHTQATLTPYDMARSILLFQKIIVVGLIVLGHPDEL